MGRLLALMALSVAALSCGDDDSTIANDSPNEVAAEGATGGDVESSGGEAETASDAIPAECSMPPYDVEIRTDGEGARESFTVVDAGIDQRVPHKDAALWLTSWDLNDDEGLIGQLFEPPAGSMHVGVAVSYFTSGGGSPDDFPEIVAGDALVHVSEAGDTDAPGVTLQINGDDGPTSSSSTDPVVDGTVLYWGDDAICVDLSYTTETGIELVGVVAAAT